MIRALRNRHRRIWTVLAVLLPLGLVIAFLQREPERAESALSSPPVEPAGLTLSYEALTPELSARLYASAWENRLLVIDLKVAPRRPVSTFYLSPSDNIDPPAAFPLGAVGERGRKEFPLDTLSTGWPQYYLLAYDQIRKESYLKIALQKPSR